MNSTLTAKRAWRKLLRPVRRLFRGSAPQYTLDDLAGPVLIAIAHPDDEVFCSGLICALRERQREVHLVCFTRGEGGDRDTTSERGSLATVREAEMTAAASALDVTRLHFLDYVDPPSVGGHLQTPVFDAAELESELETVLGTSGAATVVTHGSSGEYWHPAHLALHRHLGNVARRKDLCLWTFNAWHPSHPLPGILNRDDPSQLTVDGSSFASTRLSSLTCHQTQSSVFRNFAGGELSHFIELTATENYSRIRSNLK